MKLSGKNKSRRFAAFAYHLEFPISMVKSEKFLKHIHFMGYKLAK